MEKEDYKRLLNSKHITLVFERELKEMSEIGYNILDNRSQITSQLIDKLNTHLGFD